MGGEEKESEIEEEGEIAAPASSTKPKVTHGAALANVESVLEYIEILSKS